MYPKLLMGLLASSLVAAGFALTKEGVAVAAGASSPRCESLQGQTIGGATITTAESISNGKMEVDDLSPYPALLGRGKSGPRTITGLPAMCRVVASASPVPDSKIVFELWLPLKAWNGRQVMWGGGGAVGFISYGTEDLPQMVGSVRAGYSALSTNGGHWATETAGGLSLPPGRPQAVIDHGYRAVHVSAVAAKAISQAFYGTMPEKSYFVGCSTGGRQAMMSAQRFPTDFDGIVAGAGVFNTSMLRPLQVWRAKVIADAGLTSAKAPAIARAYAKACSATPDGYVHAPQTCDFDPAALQCTGPETAECLTPKQVDGLRKLYAGPIDPSGVQLGYGVVVGAERLPPTITQRAAEGSGSSDVVRFKSQVMSGAREMTAGEPASLYMDAGNPNLNPFFSRGGKLIMYHGWLDATIPVANSIRMYERIGDAVGPERLESSARLFVIPGLAHCYGGPGGNFFGQYGVPAGQPTDPEHNIFAALERWVETGKAPQSLVATKFTADNPQLAVVRRTRLCPYPQTAQYAGQGGRDAETSYQCGLDTDVGR